MAQSIPAAKILVVDDDVRLRDLLSRYLTEQGFQVATLPDARDIDKKLQRDPPHLVVLDLMLPGEDGLAVCRTVRARGPWKSHGASIASCVRYTELRLRCIKGANRTALMTPLPAWCIADSLSQP